MSTIPTHTHLAIDRTWCGEPTELSPGRSRVALKARPEMAADDRGLVHGGFVFGLADYAAMLAVDHPNVVLGAAEVRFLAPCQVGDQLAASAQLEEEQGAKKTVRAQVHRGETLLFTGAFTCFVPATHVLDRSR